AGFGQALGVLDRDVLAASITVMNKPSTMQRPPAMQSLFESIEHKAGVCRSRNPPADNAPGEGIDDKGDIDEAHPGRDIGEVRDPQRVWPRGLELPVDVVERARCRLVADRGFDRLATDSTLQTHGSHQASDSAAGHVLAFALQLTTNLPHAIDLEVLIDHPCDLRHQVGIALRPRRQPRRISPSGGIGVIGRWGDRQHLADRLDPIRPAVIVDERDHGLGRRSSSAWAKYADALRRISLACRSSRFSRSRALSLPAISLVTPDARPLASAAFFSHSLSVCPVQPILPAIETI